MHTAHYNFFVLSNSNSMVREIDTGEQPFAHLSQLRCLCTSKVNENPVNSPDIWIPNLFSPCYLYLMHLALTYNESNKF